MEQGDADRPRRHRALYFIIPGALATALLLFAIGMAAWAPSGMLTTFGFLVLLPASIGALTVCCFGGEDIFSRFGCIFVPLGLVIISGIGAELLNESLICLAMLAGLWLIAGLSGGLVAWWFRWQRKRWEQGKTAIYAAGWLGLPLAILLVWPSPQDDWRVVSRSQILNATPAEIWPQVLSIDGVRADEGRWNLSQDVLGIPRPSSATLVTQEGRLVRKARWGADIRFDERVTAIEPFHEISWEFGFPDKSISLYTDRHISPASDLLTIESGGYRLQPLANGQTRLTLWTRYRQRVGMPGYTASWGERFLGDIQSNVLAIIEGRVNRER